MGKLQLFFLKHKTESGQAAVEYILLLAVVISLVVTVVNSDAFKDLLGPDSNVFKKLKDKIEYTYRRGGYGVKDTTTTAYGGDHDSYYDGKSKFFMPTGEYPKN